MRRPNLQVNEGADVHADGGQHLKTKHVKIKKNCLPVLLLLLLLL